tara:strand:+ start:18 stop:698 length:681 start_codon:yes stop_codon:yes gene_type:complete
VLEDCGDDLFAGPQVLGVLDGRRNHDDIRSVGNDFEAGQGSEGCKEELLNFVLLEEGVLAAHLDPPVDMILDQAAKGRAIGWDDVLEVVRGDKLSLSTSQISLRKVAIHLITVIVSIVRVAVCVVHSDGLLGGRVEDADAVRHDSGLVESWLAILRQAKRGAFIINDERKERAKQIGLVSLVVDEAVCSNFAHFIASMLVFQKARSLRSLTSFRQRTCYATRCPTL